jgi:hypothetical protein
VQIGDPADYCGWKKQLFLPDLPESSAGMEKKIAGQIRAGEECVQGTQEIASKRR